MSGGILKGVQSLIYLSLTCTVIALLLNSNKFIKSLKYLMGVLLLVCVVSVIQPIYDSLSEIIRIDFSSDTEGGNTTGDGYNDKVIAQTAAYISDYIKTLINQKYGIEKELVNVSVTLDKSDMQNITIKSVDVTVKKKIELARSNEIAEFISTLLSTKCIVIIGEPPKD